MAEFDLVLRVGELLAQIGLRDQMYPEGSWTELILESLKAGPRQLAWDKKCIEAILQKIGIQFEGLGLMRVVNETQTSSFGNRVSYSRNDVWQLTERGLQYRLLLAGVLRAGGQPGQKPPADSAHDAWQDGKFDAALEDPSGPSPEL